MMHGYLAFDKNDKLLAPFRTWRNTNTGKAAAELTELFQFNVPMRWTVAQYYQSVLDKLPHVKEVAFLTTLAGYVQYRLTGKRVLGYNDASGMFPLTDGAYDEEKLAKLNTLLKSKGLNVQFENLLPTPLCAGKIAGRLTESGAKWLDVSGCLQSGAFFCPPEGDMGTGMIATNSVMPKTANVSSGTSANLTVVLEKPLEKYYNEIDVIATPDGYPAALVHANNCTSEINEWVALFDEILQTFGCVVNKGELYEKLFACSQKSDERVGDLIGYNFLAGEPLANTETGAPLIMRAPSGELNLANFMQMQVYSAIATLALGVDILHAERVQIDNVVAHGGFYKTPVIGQKATSAVLNVPVTIMENASEGGAWGMAILALYALTGTGGLGEFLNGVFAGVKKTVAMADEKELKKCVRYLQNYRKGLQTEKTAAQIFNANIGDK